MVDNRNPEDARLDRNLRTIGSTLPLPAGPTDRQRRSWKQPRNPAPASWMDRGVRFMRQHRTLTFAGVGSAAAAGLAVCALLLIPTPQTTVKAATILASFREAVSNAFEVTFEQVGADGMLLDGRAVVVFDRSDPESPFFESRPEALYLEARISADEDADRDLAGLDMSITMSLAAGREWLFLDSLQLPDAVAVEQPVAAAWVGAMTANGLLLELDGLMEREPFGDALAHISFEFGDLEAREGPDAAFLRMVTGQASAADFEAVVALIESAASDVTVTRGTGNRHILTASGFEFDEGDPDAEVLGRMIVEVVYQEGVGMASATVAHVGPYDGTVRFQMIGIDVDDDLFDRTRFLERPGVQRFDVSQFLPLLKSQIEDQ